MSDDFRDITARVDAALGPDVTPGPWVVNTEGWSVISSGSDSVFHGYFDGFCDDCGYQISAEAKVAISIEDAEFIAAARTLVPELTAHLEASRSVVKHLRQAHERTIIAYQDAAGSAAAHRSNSDGWHDRAIRAEEEVERLKADATLSMKLHRIRRVVRDNNHACADPRWALSEILDILDEGINYWEKP